MSQLVNTKRVPHPPARRFAEDWSVAAPEICQSWVEAQAGHNETTVSLVALSRMKALEFERKNRAAIHPEQRLLPASASKRDYYKAEIDAFLAAVSEKDPQAVLESFKLVGTGGLHRQPATIAATIGNSIGVATVLTPDPMSKVALVSARLMTQLGTTAAVVAVAPRRLRNACTEDVMPLGRAGTAPSAMRAPNMLQASVGAMRALHMKDLNRSLQQMHAAMQALERAKDGGSIKVRQETRQQLELAFARICHKLSVKANYRTASESAKIEFFGGLRYLLTSYTGTAAVLATSLIGILTPLFIDAVITGGLIGGATALTVVMYVGYQLSIGPARDGEEGAKRAIVALVKMLEVLSGENTTSTRQRGQAYADYLQERKVPPLTPPAGRRKIREDALARLQDRLAAIAQVETHSTGFDLKANWNAYSRHINDARAITAKAEQDKLAPQELLQQLSEHDNQFRRQHLHHFAVGEIVVAWKTPMRIRMEAASRLLKGKVARSHQHLLALKPGEKAGWAVRANKRALAIEQQKQDLSSCLRDMFNLELALQDLTLEAGASADSVHLARATERIAAVTDADVRLLFCGNAEEQVETVRQSKELIAGASERYNHVNIGTAALGITINIGITGADLVVTVGQATHAYPTPDTKVYKMAAISQVGAQPGVHHNFGDFAALHKREIKPSLKKNELEDPAPEHHMYLTLKGSALQPGDVAVDEAMDELVEDLWQSDVVPRKLRLTLQQAAPAADKAFGSATLPAPPNTQNLSIDLKPTTAYNRVLYKKNPFRQRMRHMRHQLAIIGRQTAMSIAGLPVQAFAQARVRNAAPVLATALASGRNAQALLRPATFDPQEVPVNGSGLPCLENAHVVTVRTGNRDQAPRPIHAHRIRQQLRSDAAYAAGQSPPADSVDAFIVQGLESGQGIFQMVSRRAHHEPGNSREKPLIGQLQEQLRQHPEKLIGGRYRVLNLDRAGGSDGDSDHGSDYLRHELVAEDTWSASRQILRVPLTQAGLKFTDRLLRAPQIARASALLDEHNQLLPQPVGAARPDKMILSFAGIGRNATLITYRVLSAAIARGEVTEASLDDALVAEILPNRVRRGPDYVHTPEQVEELRAALLALIVEKQAPASQV